MNAAEARLHGAKRDEVLYVWIKAKNKRFVEQMASSTETNMSVVVDTLIEEIREKHASRARQSAERARKARRK